jgi:hypothetical protein
MPLATNQIATVVIGPQAGGRGYRVLARSDGRPMAGAADGRLSELALVVAGWADEQEPQGVALVPLRDATAPALLMRLAFLGKAALGTIAYAHGLILDEAAFALCEGRPEALLPLIPPPDGSRQFAEAPLTVSRAPLVAAPRRDWSGLGLEWRDRLVLVDDQSQEEPVLASILASIGPAGPGARVRGWATTALLPSAGSFAPGRELQLMVVDIGRRRPGTLHHLPAHATARGFEGDRVALAPAAHAWERLKSLGAVDADLAAAVGPLRWSPAGLDLPPGEVIGPAAADALRRLSSGSGQMRLVLELARPRDDGLDQAFAAVARGLFAQLLGREALEPQHAAFYIKTLADGPAGTAEAMAPLGPLLVRPGSARWLRGRTFHRLMELGYAEAAAERADEAPELLAGLGSDELTALLDRVMLARDPALRPPALVTAALRELADRAEEKEAQAGWSSVWGAALQWRLGEAPGSDERRLGSRSVVRATASHARPFLASLARRSLRLRDDREAAPRERMDMLAGALEWLKTREKTA